MAKTLQTDWKLTLTGQYVDSADLNSQRGVLSLVTEDSLATGTAVEQANALWYDTRTLAATAENLDLAGGVTDAFGDALTFTKIKKLLIRNNNTTSGQVLIVGPATASGITTIWGTVTTSGETIGANGVMMKANPTAGFAITSATADLLRLDAGTCTVVYDIVVIGTV